MASKVKYNPEAADRYRLRMIYNQWYLLLYSGNEKLGALGPFAYNEAQEEAAKLGLQDWDKML